MVRQRWRIPAIGDAARPVTARAPAALAGRLRAVAGGTVLVPGLCVATLWLARRWLTGRQGGAGDGKHFVILESLTLGGVCRVHLVKAGGRHLLAGMDGTAQPE